MRSPRPAVVNRSQILRVTLAAALATCLAATRAANAAETTPPSTPDVVTSEATPTTLANTAAPSPAKKGSPSSQVDAACRLSTTPDPRLDELVRADPNDPQIHVTSDTGDLGREGDATLTGHVTIRTGQRLLTADKATINATDRSVQLHGNMEYLDPELHVRGSDGSYIEDGGGTFEGAQFELLDRAVRGAAQDAELTPDGIMKLKGVEYTACPPGNEDWQLAAGRIEIDQKKQVGTGRDVRLDFLGVPVFYAPWITFPVGDQRKSGLLFPAIGNSSKSGTQFAIPYYFNLAPNYDATLTTRWYSSRGFRLDPELRYLSDETRSQLDVEYLIHDPVRGESRSFVDWRHVTRFAPNSIVTIDAGNASDQDYFEDFGVGFEGTSVTFVNRLADYRAQLGAWSFDAKAQDYQVIDRELADTDAPYQILPQLTAIGRWSGLPGGLAAKFYAEATNFDRNVGPTGARIDAEPSFDWRVDRGGAFLAAGAGYRYTQYFLDNVAPGASDSPSRALPIASIDTGLVLEREAGSNGNKLQTLEPRMLYLYVPYRNQDDLPVFDTGIPDLNLVQLFRDNRYVGPDRVGDANQVSVGVTTRLLDANQGKQYLSATLGQAFYFENPRVTLPDEPARTRSTSDMVAEVELSAFKNWNARFAYQWNPDLQEGERTEAFVQYNPSPGQVLNFGYRFRRDLLEQVDASAAWPITQNWRGFGRVVYSILESKVLDQFVGFEYSSCCWALRFITRRFVSSRTGDAQTSFGIQLELKGLSNVGVDDEAFLRDAIRGYSPLAPAPST